MMLTSEVLRETVGPSGPGGADGTGGPVLFYLRRMRRSWVWNQFFVLEEDVGHEPQYVGKVRPEPPKPVLNRSGNWFCHVLHFESGSMFGLELEVLSGSVFSSAEHDGQSETTIAAQWCHPEACWETH